MQGVEAEQLDGLSLEQLLPHLQKISSLLETGQKLDRLCSGEPSDVTRLETDLQQLIPKLVEVIARHVTDSDTLAAIASELECLRENNEGQ
jgi:hypothetical protein